ncbi:hypothetical protein [Aureimonas glaciei]|uniref:Uncharacterized protein n=1 Tax=Aureimonas glaciei TaxID=1776957 RepID=A0A916Y387_9HYPH|nr:hypothetical protein [Aureimonas glaciei]GGD28581.1 hypothetical protein GCM10011335_34720 [Aureimonas glaciei]
MDSESDRTLLASLKISDAGPQTRAEELVRRALEKDSGSSARKMFLEKAAELGSGEALLVMGFDTWSPPSGIDEDAEVPDDRDKSQALGLFKGAILAGCHYGWGAIAMLLDASGESDRAETIWRRWLSGMVEEEESSRDGIETPMFLFELCGSPNFEKILAEAAPFAASATTLTSIDERIESTEQSAKKAGEPLLDPRDYGKIGAETGRDVDEVLAEEFAGRLLSSERCRAEAARLKKLAAWLRSY